MGVSDMETSTDMFFLYGEVRIRPYPFINIREGDDKMKLSVTDIIALVKAGYKMSDIKALQEEKTEEKPEEKTEEKPGEKPGEKLEEKSGEKSEDKTKEKPSVEDLKNQIRDLTAQIKKIQEDNKEADVSHHTDSKKPTDNEVMLDLFRTFM